MRMCNAKGKKWPGGRIEEGKLPLAAHWPWPRANSFTREKAVIADASGAENELASLEASEETKKGEGEMSCTKRQKEDKRRRNDIKDD